MDSMNYFDFDMSNSTNTVVHFDGKEVGNLCLGLWARSHTIYAAQVGCSIFQPAKFEQTCAFMTGRSSWWNNRNNNIVFAHLIFINFWICFWIIFSEYRCLKRWNSVNNFILWFYHGLNVLMRFCHLNKLLVCLQCERRTSY